MSANHVIGRLEARGCQPKRSGEGWEARCPAHDDRVASLSVREAEDGRTLIHCHTGCSVESVVGSLGLAMRDLFDVAEPKPAKPPKGRIVATYDYLDENGELLFQVCRFEPKGFRQRRPDGSGGWVWNLRGVRRVPFRLPQVCEAVKAGGTVYVAEGEKDVLALERLGLIATCNPGGAGKWQDDYSTYLAGCSRVVVLADDDDPGRAHAREVAESVAAVVEGVRLVELWPAGDTGQDVADWITFADADLPAARKLLEEIVERSIRFVHTPRDCSVTKRIESLPFAPLGEAIKAMPERVEWFVEGYVARRAITLLAGIPKVGKSMLAYAIVAAVQTGEDFVGLPCSQTGVLLLSEERPDTLREKAERFGLAGGRVHVLMRHQAVGASWAEVVAHAAGYCAEHDLGVLVLDGFDKWTGIRGDDENSAGAVIDAVQPLADAASKGLAVVVVAHQRKARGSFGEAVRGSNALTGAVDIILELERLKDAASPDVRRLRGLSRFERTPEELVVELDGDHYTEASAETAAAEREREQILDLLEAGTPMTAKEIAQALEISKALVFKRMAELEAVDLVEKQGNGRRGSPFTWQRTEDSIRHGANTVGVTNTNRGERTTTEDLIDLGPSAA